LNFPVEWIIRALRGEQKSAAATGRTPDFTKARQVLDHDTPLDLIAGARGTWGPTIRDYFENRLRGVGYEAFETTVINYHQKRVPAYDLMVAGHHELAAEFFRKAGNRQPDGQYRLDLG
jgi:hypothetical protein